YIPVRIDDLVISGLIVIWVLTLATEHRKPRIPSAAPLAVAWILASLVAALVGAGIIHSVAWGTSLLFWAKLVEYLTLGWIAYDLASDFSRLRLVIGVTLVTAMIVVFYGILQRLEILPRAPNYAAALA